MSLTEIWSTSGVETWCGQTRIVKRGLYQWGTTSLTGSVSVPMGRVDYADFRSVGAQSAASSTENLGLQTISATYVQDFVAPRTGTISAMGIIASAVTSASTSDSNNYTFGVTNATATLTPVDSTNAANSNKATGGSALAADTLFSFTLGAAGQLAVTAGDVLKFTATKTGTYTITNPTLLWSYSTAGGYGEDVRWTDSLGSDGRLTFSASANQIVNAARKSISPVSAGYVLATIVGL